MESYQVKDVDYQRGKVKKIWLELLVHKRCDQRGLFSSATELMDHALENLSLLFPQIKCFRRSSLSIIQILKKKLAMFVQRIQVIKPPVKTKFLPILPRRRENFHKFTTAKLIKSSKDLKS